MLFNPERNQLRKIIIAAWQKFQLNQPLEPLEQQIVDIAAAHPEYHALLSQADALEQDFDLPGQSNPFLHIALHLALREQVNTDRPHGIQAIYLQLVKQTGSIMAAKHLMLTVLEEALWKVNAQDESFNEAVYLESYKKLLS